jgi:hypothetical protein
MGDFMDILGPDFDIRKFLKWLENQPHEIQKAGVDILELRKKIDQKCGFVQRRNVEEDKLTERVDRPYVPNAKHDAWYRSDKRIRMITGGNRTGKSTCGAKEAVSWCMGFRPFYPNNDPAFRTPFTPPTKGIIVCEDWKKAARTVIVDKLKQNIPPELLANKPKKNQEGVEYYWTLKVPFDATGGEGLVSSLEIVTNNTDSASLEGPDWDFAWMDEPPRREIWIALTRGLLESGGSAWFTLTPLKEAWIKEEVAVREDCFSVTMSQYDNVYDPITGSGGLSLPMIDAYMKGLTDDEIQQRVHGKYAHLVGAVFKGFGHDHIIPPFEVPPSWPRAIFIDCHPRKPHAVGVFAWDKRQGRMFCIDAFRWGDSSFDRYNHGDIIQTTGVIDEFEIELEQRMNPSPYLMLMDPLSKEPDMVTGNDLFSVLSRKFPVDTWERVKDKKNAIYALQRLMRIDEVKGVPQFYVFENLRRVIWELQTYRWDEFRGVSRDKNDPKGTPIKKDDDFVDICMAAALYPPPDFEMDYSYDPDSVVFQY